MKRHEKNSVALVVLATIGLFAAGPGLAQEGVSPEALQRQARIQEAIERVLPAYTFIGGGGSGVLVTPDGYVLTNDHVAGAAWVWRVRTMDGVLRYADLIGTDPRGDIALLKIRDVEGMPFLELGDANLLEVGEAVIAVGNPFGMGNTDERPTVTLGIVSTLHRFQGNYTDAIMTDAALNPGNSGGPLISLEGKLVGINGQIATRFGVRANSGIGYAITVNQIRHFLQDLFVADGGYVRHGVIPGLRLPGPEANERPPLVRHVQPGSPAAAAGFKAGDAILEVEGRPVTTVTRFHGIVGTYPEGATLSVVVRRGGRKVAISVSLSPLSLVGEPSLRIQLSGASYASGGRGSDHAFHVVSVTDGGSADTAGVRAGDRILSIAGIDLQEVLRNMPLSEADLLSRILPGQTASGPILLEFSVLRDGQKRTLILDLDRGASDIGVEFGPAAEENGGRSVPETLQERDLRIVDLVEGCGLYRAGLRTGDLLLGLAGQELDDFAGYQRVVGRLLPGTTVEVVYRHGEEMRTARAVVDLQRAQ